MKLTTMALIMATFTTGAAMAESVMDPVIEKLTQKGYTDIQVETAGQTYRVEATKDGKMRELIYNVHTGRILSDRVDTDGDGQLDRVIYDHRNDDDDQRDDDGREDDDREDDDRNDGGRSDSGDDNDDGGRDDGGRDDDDKDD